MQVQERVVARRGQAHDWRPRLLNFVGGFFARQLDADQLIANVPIKSVAVWDPVGSMGIPAYAGDKRYDVFSASSIPS